MVLWLFSMCIVARRDLRLSFPWSVYTGTCLVVKGTVCECNRSSGTTLRANLTHVPRHYKSRPRLGQGSEVRVGAHARKQHMSKIRDMGESRVDVSVVPDQCDVRSIDP